MSYENAPATALLATACACCGRPLVDAVSVETGIGPDCRERFGLDLALGVTPEAHEEANKLVHAVAKKGVTKADCRAVCERLAALGFVALAERILKRFRMVPAAPVDVDALRAEYKAIRAANVYDNVSAPEFDAIVRSMGACDAESFVKLAKEASCSCRRCKTSGRFTITTGYGVKDLGACFRCDGKGYQLAEDVKRNRGYDEIQAKRTAASRAAATHPDHEEEA